MSKQEKITPLIRVISGVIGALGTAAVAFSAVRNGGVQLDFILFAKFFAGFVFLYVSFFGKYPWDVSGSGDT